MAIKKIQMIPPGYTDIVHPETSADNIIETDSKKIMTGDERTKLGSIPSDAVFTDTITTINGNTGAISKADIVALGIPSQDTNTTYTEITTDEIDTGTASTLRTITGRRVKYILDKVQGWIGNLTKADVGLDSVDNVKQATKVEFDDHLADYAHQLGDVELQTNDKTLKGAINELYDLKLDRPPDDLTNSPGNPYLISGTMEEGFFGEVPASELITGDALASECGISQGYSINSTAGWLKFAYKGKIQFVAKKPIRRSISWDAINAAKCVYGDSGDKTVTIDDKTYRVTLIKGANDKFNPKQPISGQTGGGNGLRGELNYYSEWNRLMCQIHEQAINKSWDYPEAVESDIGILEHSLGSGSQGMYNDADLVVKSGDGRYSWCQEMSTSTSDRLNRGYSGVSYSRNYPSSAASSLYGWRPVLRLVEED